MSVLNVHDIDVEVEKAVMRPGYVAAMEDYGEEGGMMWRCLQHAIQEIGLNYSNNAPNIIGWQSGNPVYRPGTPSGYNLDELGKAATDSLRSVGCGLALMLEFVELKFLDRELIDDTIVYFTGKFYDPYGKTGRMGSTYNEIKLFYYKSEIEKQGPFDLHF